MSDLLPVVVFAFNRPQKLKRILEALRPQSIDRLVVFVDGPRGPGDQAAIIDSQRIANSVAWVEKELHISDENRGSRNLHLQIRKVFEQYPAAVFLEDDCLPMPGFYAYMRRALDRYRFEPRVLSIGGYQPIAPGFFKDYPYALVSSARFMGWGWATWRERWQEIEPYIERFSELFDGFSHVPEIIGPEMLDVARTKSEGKPVDDWDFRVIVASLWLKKLHLLPVRGLVRNIGLDRSGMHGSYFGILRDYMFHNRNVARFLPENLPWPEQIELDCNYAFILHDLLVQTRLYTPQRLWQRGKKLVRRSLFPGHERRFDLDLLTSPHKPLEKRALFSYIVHPFSIPRDDPQFLGHNNIWYTHEIVRILNRMGYRVDVIDYQDTTFVPTHPYDLFIGNGGVNFAAIAQAIPAACPKIYFSTTAYWQFHNQQERARFDELHQRRGVKLPLDRYIYHEEDQALALADGVIGLGNDFTRNTFGDPGKVILINNAALFDDTFEWCNKDYQAGRMHFLYYAGRGNVHKGLDLLLEAFVGMQQHLWICTLIEPAFRRAYQKELIENTNIHLVGRLKPRSSEFYTLMGRCNFCILPSASEGGAQSVVECINQGLIPIISKECGLDVEGFGGNLSPSTIEVIRQQVERYAAYSAEQCRAFSLSARRHALDEFSEEAFSRNFEAALRTILTDHQANRRAISPG